MKITKNYLRKIISEEIVKLQDETDLIEEGRFGRWLAGAGLAAATAFGTPSSAYAKQVQKPPEYTDTTYRFSYDDMKTFLNSRPYFLNEDEYNQAKGLFKQILKGRKQQSTEDAINNLNQFIEGRYEFDTLMSRLKTILARLEGKYRK